MNTITLNDKLLDRAVTFNGETLASGIFGAAYKNLDDGGYVFQDHHGFCEEYTPEQLWTVLDQHHPKHACPEVGGPTEEEQFVELTRAYLVLSSAAENDPTIKELLESTEYRGIALNYLKAVESQIP